MDVRPIAPTDAPALRAFFERVPEGDRTFFREDVLAEGVIDGWVHDERVRRDVGILGGDVVGYVAIYPEVGWSSHVGELRLVVDPTRRRQGVGRTLARHGFLMGLGLGLTKLVVEVSAEQEPAVAMFSGLGFEAEALLKGHVRDAEGRLHDLFVMAHVVEDTWATMQTVGIDEVIGE
jgi:ribosomal protein S18 acetylase RimI-like enzyme